MSGYEYDQNIGKGALTMLFRIEVSGPTMSN